MQTIYASVNSVSKSKCDTPLRSYSAYLQDNQFTINRGLSSYELEFGAAFRNSLKINRARWIDFGAGTARAQIEAQLNHEESVASDLQTVALGFTKPPEALALEKMLEAQHSHQYIEGDLIHTSPNETGLFTMGSDFLGGFSYEMDNPMEILWHELSFIEDKGDFFLSFPEEYSVLHFPQATSSHYLISDPNMNRSFTNWLNGELFKIGKVNFYSYRGFENHPAVRIHIVLDRKKFLESLPPKIKLKEVIDGQPPLRIFELNDTAPMNRIIKLH